MSTEAQVTANRANAQKSTGPRTEEGKAKVALNAVQHGLRAQAVVLPGETPQEYDQYRTAMLEDMRPQDPQALDLAERIVGLAWQLRRAERYETAVFHALYEQQAAALAAEAGESDGGNRVLGRMLVADFSGPRVLERVQLYERRIENSFFRARAEWNELRLRSRLSDKGEGASRKATGAIPAGLTPDGVTTNLPGRASGQTKPIGAEPGGGKGTGGTNKPNGSGPAAGQMFGLNEQSQWQFPALGGLGTDWTNKANFGGPIDVLGYLADHKRLPARRAM